ncbi:hypothetical protein [Martelella mediterranea]|nr:hypothetical protein [Martelella mediterranea]
MTRHRISDRLSPASQTDCRAIDDTSAGDEPRVSSLSRAFETLSIPRSMIRTDPATGAQTVTVLNSELQQSRLAYQPSVAQIRAAFYTTGQPSEKTEIYRFDEQAYLNRDYLRQFDINTYAPQQQDAGAGDQVSLSTLPAGTPLPQGDPVAASSTATARSSTSSSKSSSAGKTTSGGGASSSGSCWSGRSPEGLSPAAAVQQAWCLMDLERPMEAAKAFEVGLGSGSSKVREEAAYGQSLAYMRMGLNSKAAVSASQAPLNRERQLDVQIQLLTNRALAAYQGGHYNDALMLLSQRDQLAPLEAGLMVIRGYSYYNLKRYFDARQVFEALAEMGNRDGMEGLSLVNQALGLETQ